MGDLQKITVHVPASLLAKAREVTGRGVTETVRRGLESLAAADAADRLRRMRGKVHLDIDLAALRRDRR